MQNRRERLRAETIAEIKKAAREQMADEGPASISLRAIARRVGMSGPGLYTYYNSRDDLVTDLIADDYQDQTAAVRAAVDTAAAVTPGGRILVACLAYRDWAIRRPAAFGLLYGNPIPGYHAPPEGPTTRSAQELAAFFLELFADAWRKNAITLPAYQPASTQLTARLTALVTSCDPALPIEIGYQFLCSYGRLHGLVTLEVFGALNPILGDTTETLFRRAMTDELSAMGLVESH
jgi:AcrR family transcriptional regulator